MGYRIPDITKKTAAEISDLTDFSVELGNESSTNKESYSMLLSQLQTLIDGCKVYEALLTQTGTGVPIATILKNTLGEIPIYTYNYIGNYVCSSTNKFTLNKTAIYIGNGINGNTTTYAYIYIPNESITDSSFEIFTRIDSGVQANDILLNTPIKIIVYP